MKAPLAVTFVVVSAIFVHSQINLESENITFRDDTNADNTTTHFGDLYLSGGVFGMGWGWLSANRIEVYDASSLWDDLTVHGDLDVYGSKNFAHPHPSDPTKVIRYSAVESGESITMARGLAKTSNGEAHISLPEHFSLVTSEEGPLTVLLTSEKVPAVLFVKSKSKTRVSVGVRPSDYAEFGEVSFAYEVKGIRDAFEDMKPISQVGNVQPVSPKRAEYNDKVMAIAEKARNSLLSEKASK